MTCRTEARKKARTGPKPNRPRTPLFLARERRGPGLAPHDDVHWRTNDTRAAICAPSLLLILGVCAQAVAYRDSRSLICLIGCPTSGQRKIPRWGCFVPTAAKAATASGRSSSPPQLAGKPPRTGGCWAGTDQTPFQPHGASGGRRQPSSIDLGAWLSGWVLGAGGAGVWVVVWDGGAS